MLGEPDVALSVHQLAAQGDAADGPVSLGASHRDWLERGGGVVPDHVSRLFARLLKEADLPPIRLHDLRHGAATPALAGGANLQVVSEMLGHSTIAITADTYTSVLPEVARQAAEAAVRLVPRRTPTGYRGPMSAPCRSHLATHDRRRTGRR
ncbi:MAG: tyrosine-type recombinase/integrase [Frankiales bacterium]|nr:tyrosine-type recombinase/integrase [Frankiales bacterium]